MSAFGPSGGRDLSGYDFVVQAVSGLMSITGDPDGPPTKAGVAVVDVLTGLYATIGILAAVTERAGSGRGQFVEVNLLSCALASLVNQASAFVNADVVPARMGNLHPSITPYQAFETASEPIAIAATNDRQFANLCEALDLPDMAADERWSSNTARVEHREAMVEALASRLRRRSCEHWVEVLGVKAVPCGPVNSIDEAFALAARLGLDPVRLLPRADGAPVATVADPITLSLTPVSHRLAPPALGADTAEILQRLDSLPQ